VLNGSARVSGETCGRVWAAASKLDYWPNTAARSLRQSRSHVLGILLPDLHGEFFSEVIRGIDHAARREKFQILISSSHAEAEAIAAAARSMRGRVDGLIVMAPHGESAAVIDRITHRLPIVLLNAPSPVDGSNVVSIDNFAGAYAVTRHLIGLGHRRIATIRGPRGNVDAEERLRGYRRALIDAGIRPRRALEFTGDFTEASGYHVSPQLLAMAPRPSAVFAANDSMATGFLAALAASGIRVPEDIAVAGFDDIAIARYLSPALTTVRVDAYELGARAVRLLLAAIAAGPAAACHHEVLPATVVVRHSCGSRAATMPSAPPDGTKSSHTKKIATLVGSDPASLGPGPIQDAGRHQRKTRPSSAGRTEALQ
jgi:LacI family transcriptional regulator